jgi:hypothetical protein
MRRGKHEVIHGKLVAASTVSWSRFPRKTAGPATVSWSLKPIVIKTFTYLPVVYAIASVDMFENQTLSRRKSVCGTTGQERHSRNKPEPIQ